MTTIMIAGDSIPLPRPEEGILYAQTWPALLQERWAQAQVIPHCLGGTSLVELVAQLPKTLVYYRPQILIMQAGIVDAAPRCLRPWETRLLNSNRYSAYLSRRYLKPFLNRHHAPISRFRNISYHSLSVFRQGVHQLQTLAKQHSIALYFVEILPGGQYIHRQSPLYEQKRAQYNQVFGDFVRSSPLLEVISTASFAKHIDDYVLAHDGHHLNPSGHDKLAELVQRRVEATFPLSQKMIETTGNSITKI